MATLVASIIGISYPVLTESICRIADRYNSDTMVEQFQTEVVLKLYNVILLPIVVMMFISPFIMLAINNRVLNVIIISLQCILLLALVLTLLYLIRIMLIYYTPKKLAKRLFRDVNLSSEDMVRTLRCAVSMMKLEAKNPKSLEYKDVYKTCSDFIIKVSKKYYPDNESQEYTIPDEIASILIVLSEYATDTNLTLIATDCIIASVYYNQEQRYHLSKKSLQIIWECLCKVSKSGNTYWLNDYWRQACEYYKENVELINVLDKETRKYQFLEFHIMLGVMFLYTKNYTMLKYIFTAIDSAETIQLVPNRFADILYLIQKMWLNDDYDSCYFLTRYFIDGISNNPNDETGIMIWIKRYFALLIIRLFTLYQEYDNIKTDPSVDDTLDKLNLNKEITESIRKDVKDYWFEGNRIGKISVLNDNVNSDEVLKLLGDYILRTDKAIIFKRNNPVLDTDKLIELQDTLVKEDNKIQNQIGNGSNVIDGSWHCISGKIMATRKLTAGMCSVDGTEMPFNLHSVLLTNLRNQLETKKAEVLQGIKSSQTYIIREEGLFDLIEQLHLTSDWFIISNKVYMSGIDAKYHSSTKLHYESNRLLYKNTQILNVNNVCEEPALFVIKKEDFIVTQYVSKPSDDGLDANMQLAPDSNNNLYTNIASIIESKKTDTILKVGRYYNIFRKKRIESIKIIIDIKAEYIQSLLQALNMFNKAFNNNVTSDNATEAVNNFNRDWIEITDYFADETKDRQSKYGLALISYSVAILESKSLTEETLKLLSELIVEYEQRESVKYKFGVLQSLFCNLGFCWHKLGVEYDNKAVDAFKKYLFYLLSVSSHTIYSPTAYSFRKYDEHLIQSLTEQKICVSSPVVFNDPFDCPIKNLLDDNKEPVSKLLLKAYGDCLRIGCFMSNVKLPFMRNPNDMASDIVYDEPKCSGDIEEFLNTSMWDRYADKGKGVCIKYKFSRELTKLGRADDNVISYFKDVEYSSSKLGEYANKTEISLFDAFFLKSDEWKQENELRYLYFDLDGNTEHTTVDAKECIAAVYFGPNCSEDNKAKVKQALQDKKLKITDLSGNVSTKDIEFYQVKLNDTKLKLEAIKE